MFLHSARISKQTDRQRNIKPHLKVDYYYKDDNANENSRDKLARQGCTWVLRENQSNLGGMHK